MSIVDLLLKSNNDPQLEQILKIPANQKYLSQQLVSKTLNEIREDARRLDEDLKKVDRQLAELSIQEYRSFILAHKTISSSHTFILEFLQHIDNMSQLVPKLQSYTQVLAQPPSPQLVSHHSLKLSSAEESSFQNCFALERKRINLLVENYSELSDLLSLPSLMNSLIDSGMYDEAIDLRDHVDRISTRFSHMPFLNKVIVEPVFECIGKITEKLLVSLRDELNLVACIKVMGYLRRLNLMTDERLAVMFLVSRSEWLERGVINKNGVEAIRQYIDVTRARLMEVVSQYQAVFSEESCASVLSSFLLYFIQDFIDKIGTSLENITAKGELEQICSLLMNFGVALSRKGFDFRFMLVSIFKQKMVKTYSEENKKI